VSGEDRYLGNERPFLFIFLISGLPRHSISLCHNRLRWRGLKIGAGQRSKIGPTRSVEYNWSLHERLTSRLASHPSLFASTSCWADDIVLINLSFPSIQISPLVKTNQSVRPYAQHLAHVCEMFLTRVRDLSHTCARCFSSRQQD
jgi:hypothetical protein